MEEDLAAETVPERLGPWRILREIGGGGMSRVYLVARADEQFQKCAALKILGLGREADTEDGCDGSGQAAEVRASGT